jgi:hypothetical protein
MSAYVDEQTMPFVLHAPSSVLALHSLSLVLTCTTTPLLPGHDMTHSFTSRISNPSGVGTLPFSISNIVHAIFRLQIFHTMKDVSKFPSNVMQILGKAGSRTAGAEGRRMWAGTGSGGKAPVGVGGRGSHQSAGRRSPHGAPTKDGRQSQAGGAASTRAEVTARGAGEGRQGSVRRGSGRSGGAHHRARRRAQRVP